MLSVVLLSVDLLSVVMLSVVQLSVMAPTALSAEFHLFLMNKIWGTLGLQLCLQFSEIGVKLVGFKKTKHLFLFFETLQLNMKV